MKRRITTTAKPSAEPSHKTQFKLRNKARPKGTIVAAVIWIVFTVILFAAAPPELPRFFQLLIGAVHALLGGLVGWFAVREFMKNRHLAKHGHGHDHEPGHQPAGIHAGDDLHDHAYLVYHGTGRIKRRYANLVGGGIFVLIMVWWLTPLAPIDVQYADFDLAAELNEAATTVILVLAEPNLPVVEAPAPFLKTKLAAQKMRSGGDNFRQGLRALATGDYAAARSQLDQAAQASGGDARKIELAQIQAELFDGNHAAAVKQAEKLAKTAKGDPLVQAHLATAYVQGGQWNKALPIATKLRDDSSVNTPERARAINFLLAIDAALWKREDSLKLEKEAAVLNSDVPSGHLAALKNNLGVLQLLNSPPNAGAARIQFGMSSDMWNHLDVHGVMGNRQEPQAAAAEQNLALAFWNLAQYDDARAQLQAAAQRRDARDNALSEKHPARMSGFLGEVLLATTLGEYQLAQNLLDRAAPIGKSLARNDAHQLSAQLLNARNQAALRQTALTRLICTEFTAAPPRLVPRHPAMIAARLRLAEAQLDLNQLTEAEGSLNDALRELNEPGRTEHPLMLIALRLKGRLETLQGKPAEAKKSFQSGLTLANQALAIKDAGKNLPAHPEVAALLAARGESVFTGAPTGAELNEALADLQAARKLLIAAIGEDSGPTHPVGGRYLFEQARVLEMAKRYAEAIQLLKEWETEYEEVMPPNHPWTAEVYELFTKLLKQTNQAQEATQYEQRAKAIRAAK